MLYEVITSDKRIDNWLVEAEQLFPFAQIAKFKFNKGTLEDKKAVLSALGSNLLLKERELFVSLKNELVLMEKASEKEKEVRNRLEPLNLPLDKAKLWAEYAQSVITSYSIHYTKLYEILFEKICRSIHSCLSG